MKLNEIDYWTPAFSQPDAVRLTRVTAATLDNWLRYAHVQPVRDDTGRRAFSFADLLTVDCMEMLIALFKMPPSLASSFARRAAEKYEDGFDADRGEVAAGEPWAAASNRLDAHFTYAREGEHVVEVVEGELRPDSVMLVLPTRMIARRLMAAVAGAPAQVQNA